MSADALPNLMTFTSVLRSNQDVKSGESFAPPSLFLMHYLLDNCIEGNFIMFHVSQPLNCEEATLRGQQKQT